MLLNSTVVFLCFFLLPGFIIVRGIEATVAGKVSQIEEERQQKLTEALDKLELFSANDRFAHFLLSSLCRDNKTQQYSLSQLKPRIAALKKRFPDSFSLVVANSAGEPIDELSDEKGYRYLYKKAFSLIGELAENSSQDSAINAVDNLEVALKRLRPLLGELLREQDLFTPFQDKRTGKSLLASGSEKKFHLWYGLGKDFFIIAFISRSFIKSTVGLKWACKNLNHFESEIVTGYTPYPPDIQSLCPPLAGSDAVEIIKAVARAEQVGGGFDRNSSAKSVSTRFLNQKIRGFSFFRAKTSTETATKKTYAQILFFFLISAFILYVRQMRFPITLTVKIKITAFFAYAIILPILVIGSLSSQFLQQAEAEMINNLHRRSQRLVEKIDAGYAWFKNEKASLLGQFLRKEFSSDPELFQDKNKVRSFNKRLSSIVNHGEIMVIDETGKDYLLGVSPRLTTNASLLREMSKETVVRMLDPDARNLNKRSSFFNLYEDIYRDGDHIEYFGIGEIDMNVFLKMLITPNFSLGYVVMVFWQESILNEEFILKNKHLFRHPEANFAVYNSEKRKMILSSNINSMKLLELCRKVESGRIGISKNFRIDQRDYIAMAMPGQKLEKMVISTLFPAEIVSTKIEALKTKAFLLMLLLILLSAATVFLLRNWFFLPLSELKSGIEAFSQRNFHKRLCINSNNELGKLMRAFNESFETLQDLEVARIVQESILPVSYLDSGNLEIAAKTEIMTRLGGDYFDVLPQSDNNVLLFIGDATGHGIPAALSMAMAKSVMLHESLSGLDPIRLMQKLDDLFKSIRKTGSKDFMTAACIYASNSDGCLTIINAGHCHPLLIKNRDSQAEIVKLKIVTPLGFASRNKFSEDRLTLETGDIIIFYTDGFYECINDKNEILGFNGFKNIVYEARNSDINIFIENIFSSIRKWENVPTDDKTLMMVRMK